MKVDPEEVRKGVDDAFNFWLIEHQVSFPELLERTIGDVFEAWLENHSAQIIAQITKAYADLHPE
jgi:hypothetical protein